MTRRAVTPAAPAATGAIATLEDIPNVGPSIAADLRQIGIHEPGALVGCEPYDLYRSLCEATGTRQDPCVLDVFISAVRFMEGAPPKPWWHYTAERKRRFPVLPVPAQDSQRNNPRRSMVLHGPS
jgi:hypothetical protein